MRTLIRIILVYVQCFFGSGTDSTLLLIFLLFSFFLGRRCLETPVLRRFKLDRDEIWQDCSSSKYASTDGVQVLDVTS